MNKYQSENKNISNRLSYCFIFIGLIYCIIFPEKCWANDLCSGKNTTLDCLTKNFAKLPLTNYEGFWGILNKAAKKALQCKTISDVVPFFELVRFIKTNNIEFNEFFADITESMCIKDDKCFFNALANMKKEEQNEMVYRMTIPVHDNLTSIIRVFTKYKNNKKYKRIVERFFKVLVPEKQ